MIIAICQLDIILVVKPNYRFIGQLFETFLVDSISNDDGKESTELPFEIDETGQTKC